MRVRRGKENLESITHGRLPEINGINTRLTSQAIESAEPESCVEITFLDGVNLVKGFAQRRENNDQWLICVDQGRLRFTRSQSELLDWVGSCVFPPVPVRQLPRRAPPSMRGLSTALGAISLNERPMVS